MRRDRCGLELNRSSLRGRRFSQNTHSSVSGSHMSAFLHCIRELNRSSLNVVKTGTVCSSGGPRHSNSLAERTYVFAELQPWLTARPRLLLHPPRSKLPLCLLPHLCSFRLSCAFPLHLGNFRQKQNPNFLSLKTPFLILIFWQNHKRQWDKLFQIFYLYQTTKIVNKVAYWECSVTGRCSKPSLGSVLWRHLWSSRPNKCQCLGVNKVRASLSQTLIENGNKLFIT